MKFDTPMNPSPIFFHIGLHAPRSNANNWGDYVFAENLRKALGQIGHKAQLFFRDETPVLANTNNVVLWILGTELSEPIANVVNMVWMISPPNAVGVNAMARHQSVFFASEKLSKAYGALGVNSVYLPQATDPDVFNPERGAGKSKPYGIVFVGNLASRASRKNVKRAIDFGFDVTVWGRGWESEVPEKNFGGNRLETDQLASVYARSNTVLNSHMPNMAKHGMMSNRTFDALASGARVISDDVSGFTDPALSYLVQTDADDVLYAALQKATDQGPPDLKERAKIAATVADRYSFLARARVFSERALEHLKAGDVAASAYRPLFGPSPASTARSLVVTDIAVDGAKASQLAEHLDALVNAHALTVSLQLSDATARLHPRV